MLLGLLAVLTHLSHLTSFGIPYLMPFVGADLNNYEDERDFIWRQPFPETAQTSDLCKSERADKADVFKEEIGGKYVLRKQSNFRQTGVPPSDV